ncbi:MAG: T9SS type A sorting domain-containing protein [Chitinophagaceae bacterium]|nr:T9SS type A sorting domain-containing protein [Chitinophagaceae bacterium]
MRKYFSPFLFTLLFSFPVLSIHAQSLAWATQFSGTEFKLAEDITLDAAGNVYTVGGFQGVVDFDPGPGVLSFNSGGFGSTDIFIVKQSASGALLWARQIGSGQIDVARAAKAAASGYIDIVGDFRGTVDFDPGSGVTNLTGSANGDIFILRLSDAGNFISVKQMNSTGGSLSVRDMARDKDGNSIMMIGFSGTVDFDPGAGVFNITSSGGSDMAICKLSSSGNFLWAKAITNPSSSTFIVNAVKADSTGNILFCGYFFNSIDFDPGPAVFNITSDGGADAFVAKLSPAGDFVWAKHFRNSLSSNALKLDTDASGNCYVSGFFEGGADFDPGPADFSLSSSGDRDAFVVKLSDAGSFQWARRFGSGLPDAINSMAMSSYGTLFAAVDFKGTVDFDPGTGISNITSNGDFDICLLQLTTNGELISAKRIGGSNPDAAYYMVADQQGDVILTGNFGNTVDFDPGPGTTNLTSLGIYPYNDLFVARFSKSNTITGTTFNDVNGDGVRQPIEPLLADVILKGTRNSLDYYAISDSNGVYAIEADTGSYTVSPSLPLYYTSIVPASHSAAFGSLYGQTDTANHFALVPSSIIKDLRVNITPVAAARPGFLTTYRITYTNKGTETIPAGNITLTHDNTLSFQEAAPVPASNTAPVIVWNFTSLSPSMSESIDVRFRVSPADTLGQILKSYVTANPVAGDFNPGNNTDSTYHIVTGSYDPNDKRVTPDGAISTDFVSTGKYLDYVIRFQNTGTDTAFTVVLKDTLSNKVEISSFEMLSASHNYSVNMKGNGIVEWRFNNILLPDSNVNEPKSHGFVRYRIKTKNTLAVGDQIKNKAAIYFDFNAPVITNETINTVTVITAVNPVVNTIETKVFPNPAYAVLHIRSKGYFHYTLYDAIGRTLMMADKNYNEAVIDLTGFSKGIYFIEIRNKKGRAVHKILITGG